MSLIDVKTARDISELKRQAFVNFLEISRKLDLIGDSVIDYSSGNIVINAGSGGGGSSNTFDIIYLKDTATWITRNGAGDLVLRDANAGEVTLSEIKTLLNILWTFGSAYGVKFANAAGTEKMIGLMEGADGITYFNNTSEVE